MRRFRSLWLVSTLLLAMALLVACTPDSPAAVPTEATDTTDAPTEQPTDTPTDDSNVFNMFCRFDFIFIRLHYTRV